MSTRHYICGQVGSGIEADPYRPEIADDLTPHRLTWAANQEFESLLPPTPLPRFIVHAILPEAVHADLAYSPTNPNGFDWLEVHEDGTVTLHAP